VVAFLFAGVWWTGITSLDERVNTKLDHLRSEFRAEFKEVDGKFDLLNVKVDGKLDAMRAEFHTDFKELQAFLQRSFERSEDDKRHLERQYFTIRDELKYGRSCASNGSSAAAATAAAATAAAAAAGGSVAG
jgi:hypothetical protein